MKDLLACLATEDQGRLFLDGPFGKLTQFIGDTFPKQLAHLLVLHQVNSKKANELIFKIDGKILVFTLFDFLLMSG